MNLAGRVASMRVYVQYLAGSVAAWHNHGRRRSPGCAYSQPTGS